MIRALIIGVAVASVMVGCGRRFAARCEDPAIYTGSQEIPPVRVPGDLSVPPETEALRIPQPDQVGSTVPNDRRGPCLESPPTYFGSGANEAQGAQQPQF